MSLVIWPASPMKSSIQPMEFFGWRAMTSPVAKTVARGPPSSLRPGNPCASKLRVAVQVKQDGVQECKDGCDGDAGPCDASGAPDYPTADAHVNTNPHARILVQVNAHRHGASVTVNRSDCTSSPQWCHPQSQDAPEPPSDLGQFTHGARDVACRGKYSLACRETGTVWSAVPAANARMAFRRSDCHGAPTKRGHRRRNRVRLV